MSKLMVLTVSEKEEHILSYIHRYLQSEADSTDISSKQEMVLSFPNLEIDIYRREVRQNKKIIRLTDLEFRFLHYLASRPGRVFTYQQIYEGVWVRNTSRKKEPLCSISAISGKNWNQRKVVSGK